MPWRRCAARAAHDMGGRSIAIRNDRPDQYPRMLDFRARSLSRLPLAAQASVTTALPAAAVSTASTAATLPSHIYLRERARQCQEPFVFKYTHVTGSRTRKKTRQASKCWMWAHVLRSTMRADVPAWRA